MKALRFVFSYVVVEIGLLFLFVAILFKLGYSQDQITLTIHTYQWVIALLLGVLFIPMLYKNYQKIGKKPKKLTKKSIFTVILFGISLSILYNIFIYYMNQFFSFTNLYVKNDHVLQTIFCTGLIGPFIEEYMFRGLMYHDFKQQYSTIKSILFTTTLFALFHFNFIQAIYAFTLGFILLYVYEKYENIHASILLHMTSNIMTTLLVCMLQWNFFVLNYALFLAALCILLFLKRNI